MAKGLRSKSKRRFRTLKRQEVVKTPAHLESKEQQLEAMAVVLAAPAPAGDGGDAPASMEGLQQGGEGMAVDGAPEGASTNPAKVLKRLRKARLAATRGVVQGQKKRARPLAGANQFHKRKSKKK